MKQKKIIVAGDICIDNLYYTYAEKNPRDKNNLIANWQNARNTEMYTMPGGVLLLNEFIKSATGIETISYDLPQLSNDHSSQMIRSLAELSKYKESGSNKSLFRICNFLGYTGPKKPELSATILPDGDLQHPDLVIFDDAGNGFRNNPSGWQDILDNIDKDTRIIYKMAWPLFQGDLFKEIIGSYAKQLILVIKADDLREEGFNISRNLSWEKTILDFIRKVTGSKLFQSVRECPDIIIRFDLEGTIHYFNEKQENKRAFLHYYPDKCEDELVEKTSGNMQGMTAAFVAGIAEKLLEDGDQENFSEKLASAIPHAMDSVTNLLSEGFDFQKGVPAYPVPGIFQNSNPDPVRKIEISFPDADEFHADEWSILYEETQMLTDLEIAMNYVESDSTTDLKNVPIVNFGHLVLIDRKEIERFRTVSNLMQEYFNSGKSDQPLSIGVFGPPGSGKSFGVKQLAKEILGSKATSVEFNLSQFQSVEELIRAFHRIRDYTLKGSIPLIFFDEFDSAFNSAPLGWLKYFLAAMQDGEFRDGDNIHPIGKAVFIFAGGTSSSFNEFSRESINDPKILKEFKDAKGPDFVSRLKGYVNITGVNQISTSDRLHVIRRAVILRALLSKHSGIVDDKKRIYIDRDVLRAMLIIDSYKHGSRSMGSIIEMSTLSSLSKFEKSALPSRRQLDLHLNGDLFMKLVDKDQFYETTGEELAKEIHRHYLVNQNEEKNPKPKSHPSMQPWDKLREDLKESNRQQAFDFFTKLLQVQCFYVKSGFVEADMNIIDQFEPEEIELLAEMEHKRWNSDKIANGWIYGKPRDDENKIHDNLVPWKLLSEDIKKYDRDAIKAIPIILKNAGYVVFRIVES